jgi:hypothetical protein
MYNEENKLPKKIKTIFRVLSVLTLLEGGLGLLMTASALVLGLFKYEALDLLSGYKHPKLNFVYVYLIGFGDVVFMAALVIAGLLLWKQRRRGLQVLAWTLVAEFFLVVLFAFTFLPFVGFGYSSTQSYIVGTAAVPFTPQIITAFPIIAGFLIFFAYRYLGIPARPANSVKSSDPSADLD